MNYAVNGMWPSPFNSTGRPTIDPDRKLLIADCTLRDGEQQAGVAFDSQAKVEIARALDKIGIYEIEAGTVASSDEDRQAIVEMCRIGLRAKISVLCRGLEGDIDLAQKLGVWGVRLSFPVSEIERKHKLKGISDDDYIKRALELTEYAASRGLYVVFSPYDTTRADIKLLLRLVAEFSKTKTVHRLRIVDTTGCALPAAISTIVGEVRRAAPEIPVEIHCHNDFGLACANTLAGVEAGADYISSTVNGLGERCGNAANEEVIMALEVLYGYRTGINLAALTELSQLVRRYSRIDYPVNKAVVGENAFRHEAGMVVAGVLKDPFTAEAYAPEIVGQKRQILIGKKSGLVSVAFKVGQLGLDVDESVFPRILETVKSEAARMGRALTDDEFRVVATASLP